MASKTNVKKQRDPKATRAKILDVAFWEVFKRGFHAVSINDILAKTNLTKGAFFHHFPTKEDLGYALVDETLKEMVLARWIRPLDEFENPVDGIVLNLKKIIDNTPDDGFELGCPLNNLIQEMSTVDTKFRDKLHAVLEIWISGVEKHLKRAQQRGYLKKDANPRRLAEFVVMNHEGAFGMVKSMRDKRVFRSLHASLKDYLKTIQSN